ncbi:MAG TPA: hypothetical protein VFE28_10195 [Candidatus Krumholzibacteria bacterium]|nr:hypothetical protein [Candidatus Krumholzibacteria bacterium]
MQPRAVLFSFLALLPAFGTAQAARHVDFDVNKIPCCEYSPYDAIVWTGTDSLITLAKLAAYCAPILWFSPDEPLLAGAEGTDIRMPTSFPFEAAPDAPLVYYRVRTLLRRLNYSGAGYFPTPDDRGQGVLNLKAVAGIDLDYFYYYPSEAGFGGHHHDVESTEMKLVVWARPQCNDCPLSIIIATVKCKAHGVLWYDNTLGVDQDTRFPMTVLVEEGKHAGCTDKNGDGYYTPGYDVNRRANDAWGVRDIISGGHLFAGSFQSWFAKVRTPPYRVFPPLPEDSPLRDGYTKRGVYAGGSAQYELRPFPRPDLAKDDPALVPFIADKGDPEWPAVSSARDIKNFGNWITQESFVKSVNFAFRMDGRAGFSTTFPLFIFWHFSDPLTGGWIVNRLYFMDDGLRDFGWTLLYTPSASRWLDGYFSLGYESDENDLNEKRRYGALETGIKFRANIRHSKLSFLSKLTDFWGVRAGLQASGLLPVERFTYVIEVGGGSF